MSNQNQYPDANSSPWSSDQSSGNQAGSDQSWNNGQSWNSDQSASTNQSWGSDQQNSGQQWQSQPSASDAWNQSGSNDAWNQNQGAGSSWDQGNGTAQGYDSAPYSPYGDYAAMGMQEDTRSGALGLTSLIMSLVALAIGIGLSIVGGLAGAKFYDALPPGSNIDSQNIPTAAEQPASTMALSAFGMLLPSVLGLAALVIGIIGAQRAKNRGMAITGLILAIVGPILCAILWGAIALPHVKV